MPSCSESFRYRTQVWGCALLMIKMRYSAKPNLRDTEMSVFAEYVDFLCVSQVWGVVSKVDGVPIAFLRITHVLGWTSR